jgi:hypothetical protein
MLKKDRALDPNGIIFPSLVQYSKELAETIMNKSSETPLSILIDGEFGSGKTTLMKCIRDSIDADADKYYKNSVSCDYICKSSEHRLCRTYWFDVSKYNDVEDMVASFYYELIAPVKDRFQWDLCVKGFKNAFAGLELKLKGVTVPTPKLPFSRPIKAVDNSYLIENSRQIVNALTICGGDYCKDTVLNQGRILVVLIDDLDRVATDNILGFLKALKEIENNMTGSCVFLYALNYSEIVQRAGDQEDGSIKMKSLFDKYCQLHLKMPLLNDGEYLKWIDDKFSDVEIEIRHLMSPHFGRNPRKAIKLLNKYAILHKISKDEGLKEAIAILLLVDKLEKFKDLRSKIISSTALIGSKSKMRDLREIKQNIREQFILSTEISDSNINKAVNVIGLQ